MYFLEQNVFYKMSKNINLYLKRICFCNFKAFSRQRHQIHAALKNIIKISAKNVLCEAEKKMICWGFISKYVRIETDLEMPKILCITKLYLALNILQGDRRYEKEISEDLNRCSYQPSTCVICLFIYLFYSMKQNVLNIESRRENNFRLFKRFIRQQETVQWKKISWKKDTHLETVYYSSVLNRSTFE